VADSEFATVALPTATARWLAETWLKDALEEHASIAAFARFTMHLLSVGAPPDLVLGAQRASIDEIHHARLCFALAGRYAGTLHGPGPLSLRDAVPEASLADVAALAAEEGCVGETLGAALAREQLSVARDPEVVRALRKIVRDEARHAELAWSFVRWAVLRGGNDVRRVVADRIHAATRAARHRDPNVRGNRHRCLACARSSHLCRISRCRRPRHPRGGSTVLAGDDVDRANDRTS
jgi:hypothetical protein